MTIGDESDPNRPESEPEDELGPDAEDPSGPAERAVPRVPTRITADEQIVDDLVGGLFRDVDSRFSNLEQRVQKAREDLSETDVERVRHRDIIAASAAREAVAAEVATLRADVERQATELVDRSRQIEALRARLDEAETRADDADEAERAAQTMRQELHEERRELARIRALLDARAVEREELANATQRLQHEKEQVDVQLAAALESVEEVDQLRTRLVDDVAQLEAARQAEAAEHLLRQQDLADARGEIRRLSEQVAELTVARDEALQQVERSDSAVERRANEVNYLNRRIDSLTERAGESDQLEAEVKGLLEQQTILARQIADLQRDLETKTAEADASAKAVEAIAERAAQHDDLVATVATLEAQLAESRAAVTSAEQAAIDAQTSARAESEARAAAEVSAAEAAAEAEAAHAALAARPVPVEPEPAPGYADEALPFDEEPVDDDGESSGPGYVAPVLQAPEMPTEAPTPELTFDVPATEDLVWADDPAPAPDDLEVPTPEVPDVEEPVVDPPVVEVPEAEAPAIDVPVIEPPVIEVPDVEAPAIDVPVIEVPEVEAPAIDVPVIEPPVIEVPEIEVPEVEAPTDAADAADDDEPEVDAAEFIEVEMPDIEPPEVAVAADAPALIAPVDDEPAAPTPAAFSDATAEVAPAAETGGRRRVVLPAEMQPDTPEAVEYLLAQPGVTAIVDARSFCGRTGIRPSELFDRIEALRDRFDVPVEVVVTPVSTPVGGAPTLPAIGVHHVTGADTVSDRVRALCIGFPPDQQLVVVAGDDHVRRAAIGEEANVVDPAVVLGVT